MEWNAATLPPLITEQLYTPFESLLLEEQNGCKLYVPQWVTGANIHVEIEK